ncbi:SPOR domain-containing protein [Microbacterium amylolyticum]|uniref:SPOR domain-containing protein n=1 Tax=Microbacterium amylolyticum TaxID=936337 RepID=A0ABS4ZDU4_9MICO|nr:SPOR domain-containing protein [Microbacterium amylolyticum]MBP2435462.1 hypothetical protein [Microbacterium amylolyticum]
MATEFWYNMRTGEVEEGKQSGSLELAGPFSTRDEAARAPDILRERADAWREDEEAEKEWREGGS